MKRATPIKSRDYAECRSLGHSWKHRGTYGSDDTTSKFRAPFGMQSGCIGYHSQCTVCGTDRVKWITRSGDVISRYTHPDGYSLHGEDRLSPMEWRRTFVARVFEEFTQHEQPRKRRAS